MEEPPLPRQHARRHRPPQEQGRRQHPDARGHAQAARPPPQGQGLDRRREALPGYLLKVSSITFLDGVSGLPKLT